jgi:hypothetical protein
MGVCRPGEGPASFGCRSPSTGGRRDESGSSWGWGGPRWQCPPPADPCLRFQTVSVAVWAASTNRDREIVWFCTGNDEQVVRYASAGAPFAVATNDTLTPEQPQNLLDIGNS